MDEDIETQITQAMAPSLNSPTPKPRLFLVNLNLSFSEISSLDQLPVSNRDWSEIHIFWIDNVPSHMKSI